VGQAAGHPAAFLVVIFYAVLWLAFSPATFEWNAVATLAVFAMTLFIQRANRRDNLALHAKLDELLRVNDGARSRDPQNQPLINPGGTPKVGYRTLLLPQISASGSGFYRNECRVFGLFRRDLYLTIPKEKRRGNSCRL
jgi:Low affinity iron permease